MKKIYAILFICMMSTGTIHAQKQYDCYRIQEFTFNTGTQAYDKPAERADFSKFVINEQGKSLTQQYDDGTAATLTIKTVNSSDKNSTSYEVISPADGYLYIYRISPSSQMIEVLLVQNNKETLLKKYLYKA